MRQRATEYCRWEIISRVWTENSSLSATPAPASCWGPPSLLSNGYRGVLSPGVKRGRGVTLTTHHHLVPRLRMSRSYTSSPPCASMACRTALLLLYFYLPPLSPLWSPCLLFLKHLEHRDSPRLQYLVFSTWDAILITSVALQVDRLGNSSGTNYKHDHVTYSNAFSFHSCAFRFMSNVAVKWYTFHVYTLYNFTEHVYSMVCMLSVLAAMLLWRRQNQNYWYQKRIMIN
jgi:hypothetical protein